MTDNFALPPTRTTLLDAQTIFEIRWEIASRANVSYYQDGFEAGACDRAQGYPMDNDALHSHLRHFTQGYIDGYNTGTINEFIPEVLS